MYRGFKQQCPNGVVQEDAFKDIYSKFFENDTTMYAHHVFRAFDVNGKGEISFKDLLVSLSSILRGSACDRLRWIFRLYDVDGDGVLTKTELRQIVSSVYDIIGCDNSATEECEANEHADSVFRRLDCCGTGALTGEQFVDACLKDKLISECLRVYCGDGIDFIC